MDIVTILLCDDVNSCPPDSVRVRKHAKQLSESDSVTTIWDDKIPNSWIWIRLFSETTITTCPLTQPFSTVADAKEVL